MKAFVFSIVLHIVIVLSLFLSGVFDPVETNQTEPVPSFEEVEQKSFSRSQKKVKQPDKQVDLKDPVQRKEVIEKSIHKQVKVADRMTPVQKTRVLEDKLGQIEHVEESQIAGLTMEVLKILNPEQQSSPTAPTGSFDYNNCFYSDVRKIPEGMKVVMEDSSGKTLEYTILRKDMTEDDLALLRVYEASNKNRHLKTILRTFTQFYTGDASQTKQDIKK